MVKRIISILMAVLTIAVMLLPATGCGKDGAESGTYPVTVAGVTIEKQPETVVCLSVNYSEVIVDMGYVNYLDGRPGNAELAQLQAIQPCGTSDKPAVDNIINMGTDLIIVDTVTPIATLEQFSAAGITVLQLIEPTTRTGFLNLYRCIGTALNGNGVGYNAGETAAQNIITQLDSIERTIMFEEPVNVCLFTNDDLTACITGDMFASFLMEMAGGFNICIEGSNGIVNTELRETIISSRPDIILCPIGSENKVRSQRDLDDSGAYINNKIYGYDTSKFNSLGSDLVLAAWELAHLFHPTVVTSEDLPFGAVNYYPDYSGTVIETTEEEYEQMKEEQQAQEEAANGGN